MSKRPVVQSFGERPASAGWYGCRAETCTSRLTPAVRQKSPDHVWRRHQTVITVDRQGPPGASARGPAALPSFFLAPASCYTEPEGNIRPHHGAEGDDE